jgi:hypothetical protein
MEKLPLLGQDSSDAPRSQMKEKNSESITSVLRNCAAPGSKQECLNKIP